MVYFLLALQLHERCASKEKALRHSMDLSLPLTDDNSHLRESIKLYFCAFTNHNNF